MVSLLGPFYYLVKVYIAHAGRRCRFENEQDPPPPPPPPPGEELKRLLDPCMTDVSKVKIAQTTALATISHVVYRHRIMSSEGRVPTKERRQLNYSKPSLTCEKLSQAE